MKDLAPCITSVILAKAAALFTNANSTAVISFTASEWLALIAFTNRHFLVPALRHALSRHGTISTIPDDVHGYLDFIAGLNEARSEAIKAETLDIIAVLNKVNVQPLLLKGSAILLDKKLVHLSRMLGDIDVLVQTENCEVALAALLGAGFTSATVYPKDYHTVADLRGRARDPAPIDLHRDLFNYRFKHLLPAHEVFRRSQQINREGVRYRIPLPSDHALHILLHSQVQHSCYYELRLDLRTAHDLAAMEAVVDWHGLQNWAISQRLETVLETMLLAAEEFFGLGWPLPEPAGRLAQKRYRRCRDREIAGQHPLGIWDGRKLQELFAPDLLAARFGTRYSYMGNLVRQVSRIPVRLAGKLPR